MSDTRLERLAELWQRSLEQDLAGPDSAEFSALMQDPALVEAFTDQAVANTEAPSTASLGMPPRVRSAFQRNFQPLRYWAPRIAFPLAAVGLVGVMFLSGASRPPAATMASDEEAWTEKGQAYEVVQRREPAARPTLGPPPGMQGPGLRIQREGSVFEMRLQLARPGMIDARVVDADGALVRVLRRGEAPAGELVLRWIGVDEVGRRIGPGAYEVLVDLDGRRLSRKELEILAQ